MKGRTMIAGLVAAGLCLMGAAASAQESGKGEQAGMSDSAAMAAMMKYAAPGEHHKHLTQMAGNWTFTQKMWQDPAAPPMESKGLYKGEMILGGRFLKQEYQGDFMGMPFMGMGIAGYDIFKQTYVSTWVDNMGTMMVMSTGSCSGDGKTMTFTGTMDDVMTGEKNKKFREVLRFTSPDSFVFEMHVAMMPGQPESKIMEITHTRVK